jgi:DNA polymerase bacteriophage-type
MLSPTPEGALKPAPRERDGVRHLLHRDYETRSVLLLNKVGAHRYAADPRTEILCAAYAIDAEPPKLWTPGDAVPAEFVEAAGNPSWVVAAHNDSFETQIERHILTPRFNWPTVPLERHVCTMVAALALALPAKLEKLARALDLVHQKDAAGHRLMLQMTKPRKARKDEDPDGGPYWFDDQERLLRLYEYCVRDVEVERELHARLPSLSAEEQALYLLSERINERGFCVDRDLAAAVRKIASAAVPEIDAELAEVTGGAVTKINQIQKLQIWLQQQGCVAKSLDKKSIEELLETELPPKVQRVLELRQDGGQAAVKKINALLQRAGNDGRVRGAFQFHKASTGRWAGEGFQPQNLKRPEIDDVEAALAAVQTGDYDHVRSLYPRALSVLGDLSRSLIVAPAGCILLGGDLGAIESRVLAWVAGETWKLEAYRRYDATQDPHDEPYAVLACRMLHVAEGSFTRESPERAYGKTGDLACGYQGGTNAIEKFAPGVFDEAEKEQIKTEWRAAHPRTVQFWHDVDRAAWDAVNQRGRVISCGPVAFKCDGDVLFLKLPSSRKLSYPHPRIRVEGRETSIVYMDNSTGRWRECRDGRGAYGGVWTENIVSAISRDILVEAMLRIEATGRFPIVLHVHDELVCEVADDELPRADEFTELMTRAPAWAPTLPIAAKAWSGPRFCK